MYSGYEITFYGAGSWSFDNEIARNVINFGADNSSSFHADNHKHNFLVLVNVQLSELIEDFIHKRKSLVSVLVK